MVNRISAVEWEIHCHAVTRECVADDAERRSRNAAEHDTDTRCFAERNGPEQIPDKEEAEVALEQWVKKMNVYWSCDVDEWTYCGWKEHYQDKQYELLLRQSRQQLF